MFFWLFWWSQQVGLVCPCGVGGSAHDPCYNCCAPYSSLSPSPCLLFPLLLFSDAGNFSCPLWTRVGIEARVRVGPRV